MMDVDWSRFPLTRDFIILYVKLDLAKARGDYLRSELNSILRERAR